jgi:hypothetical protein
MLTTTLTEPAIPLFVLGIVLGYRKFIMSSGKKHWDKLVSLSLVLAWFAILVTYIVIRRPAMYDGIRHFLFILPPVFIFAGQAIQFVLGKLSAWAKSPFWLHAGLGLLLITPGINGIAKLHPYEYTYYNAFVGGTSGVFRNYETEFWLTCYKEAVQSLNEQTSTPANLFVKREAYIAAPYANENINVQELRGSANEVRSGDYILVNTRTNEDQSTFSDAPIVVKITRVAATFCIIRQIP